MTAWFFAHPISFKQTLADIKRFLPEVNDHSYTVAQNINSQIKNIKSEILLNETEQIFNDIWNDEAVSNFYCKLTGLVDSHYKTEITSVDYFQQNIVTPQELDLAFLNVLITYRTRIIEYIRDTIINEETDMLASKMLSLFEKISIEITNAETNAENLIASEITNSVNSIAKNRSFLENFGVRNRDELKAKIKDAHREIFFQKINSMLSEEADKWSFSKSRIFYLQLRYQSELDTDFKRIDKFLLIAESSLAKTKISQCVTSYTRNFLKYNVSASKIEDFREIFYGPYDIVRTFIKKNQGEEQFKKFSLEKFEKYVFAKKDFQKLAEDLAEKVSYEIKSSINEYASYSSDYIHSSVPIKTNQQFNGNYSNKIGLPDDRTATIMSVLDIVDSGVIASQLLIAFGIIAAPETGGLSIVLTVAGLVWDACLLIKDFVINPSHEVVQIVEIRNSVQEGLCEIMVKSNHDNQKGLLELSYKHVDDVFSKLEV
jgi:hypothetical protein